MTPAEATAAIETLQNVILVMFGCLCILAALIVLHPDTSEKFCLQHKKPESKCKDEHRD